MLLLVELIVERCLVVVVLVGGVVISSGTGMQVSEKVASVVVTVL